MLTVALLIPIVAIVATFTFTAVVSWAESRRKEREAYYRHETYRKMLELPGAASQAIIDLMREEEDRETRRRIEGMRLAGLILIAAGVGLMVFLRFLTPGTAVFLSGLLPLLIGIVMAIYAFLTKPHSLHGTSGLPRP
jgi:hypothetical protein